jgi:hypothetical protein
VRLAARCCWFGGQRRAKGARIGGARERELAARRCGFGGVAGSEVLHCGLRVRRSSKSARGECE